MEWTSNYGEATAEYRGYKVEILQDMDPDHADPMDDDSLGTMALQHDRYVLGHVPSRFGVPSNSLNATEASQADQIITRCRTAGGDWGQAASVLKREMGATVVLPVTLYDHGGITVSAGHDLLDMSETRERGPRLGWDYSAVGVVFDSAATREMTGVRLEHIEEVLRSEVKVYAEFLEGQVYGYRITDPDGDEVDSCWGFIGNESVRFEAEESLRGSPPLPRIPLHAAVEVRERIEALVKPRGGSYATETRAVSLPDGTVYIDYRGTRVVTVTPEGKVMLDTGGWPTRTTMRRMDDAGLRVYGSTLRNGVLPRNPRPWTVALQGHEFEFNHGGTAESIVTSVNPYTSQLGWASRDDARITHDTLTLYPVDVPTDWELGEGEVA